MENEDIPSQFGNYEIIKQLGSGGIASVFQAKNLRTHTEVALKVLPAEFSRDSERFLDFAKEIAGLEHPAIVPVFDYGIWEDRPFLSTRLMRGGPLSARVDGKPLLLVETLSCLSRLAAALDFAHEQGFVHKSIKPKNILFDKEGQTFLADFGFVDLVSTIGVSVPVNTNFMSPEQVKHEPEITGASDIYSIGLILFLMLTGRHPYGEASPGGMATRILTEPVPEVHRLNPDLPGGIQPVIERALALEPRARYPTAHQLAAEFQRVIAPQLPEDFDLPVQEESKTGIRERIGQGVEQLSTRLGDFLQSSRRAALEANIEVLTNRKGGRLWEASSNIVLETLKDLKEDEQAEYLVQVVPLLHEDTLQDALAIAGKIHDPSSRARVLIAIAARKPESERDNLTREFISTLQEIGTVDAQEVQFTLNQIDDPDLQAAIERSIGSESPQTAQQQISQIALPPPDFTQATPPPGSAEAQQERKSTEEEEVPETPAPLPEREVRCWLVTANPKRYQWKDATDPEGVFWTGVRGKLAQDNLQQSSTGDIVLAYASSPQQKIVGFGHIASEPYPIVAGQLAGDRQAVQITIDRLLGHPLSSDEMRAAVPFLDHFTRRGRPLSFSVVTPYQWSVLRELIRYRNPEIEPELPDSNVSPVYRIEIEKVKIPDQLFEGQSTSLSLNLKNTGNTTWHAGETMQILISTGGETFPTDEIETLTRNVPPGGTWTTSATPIQAGRLAAGFHDFSISVEGPAWGVRSDPVSITLRVLPPEGKYDLTTMLAQLNADDPGIRLEFLKDLQNALGAIKPEAREPLVTHGLIPRLFDNDLNVRKAALYSLYAFEKNGFQTSELIRKALADRPEVLPAIQKLVQPRVTQKKTREWLESLLPHKEPARVQPPSQSEVITTLPEADPATVMVYNNLILREITGPAVHPPAAETLEIHLTPSRSVLAEEVKGNLPVRDEHSYQVVLTLSNQKGGHLQQKYYEGPLLLEKRGHPGHRGTRDYGETLYEALFNEESAKEPILQGDPRTHSLETGYRTAMARRTRANDLLHLQVRINSQTPELHNYKWEYLWDPEDPQNRPLACKEHTPFSRVLHVSRETDHEIQPITPARPMRILAVVASPPDLNPDWEGPEPENDLIQQLAPILEKEIEALRQSFDRLKHAPIEPLTRPTLLTSSQEIVSLEALRGRLITAREQENRPFHGVHFLCHGVMNPEDGKAYLVLQDHETGRATLVPEDAIARNLSQFPELQLVVLASCLTALETQNNALKGIARRLVAAGMPAVVAMQDLLEFTAAQHFSQRLYARLVRDGMIDVAVNLARGELFDRRWETASQRGPGKVSYRQWGVPVLFMSVPDGKLFDVQTDEQTRAHLDSLRTRALEYDQLPGEDAHQLASRMANRLAANMGVQVNLDPAVLSQAITQAFEAARPRPDHPVSPITPRVFGQPARREERRALIAAATEYRRHPARRTILFLRSLAHEHIARLMEENAPDLRVKDFREQIWEGGEVILTDTLQNQKMATTDILEGGPSSNDLVTDAGAPISFLEQGTQHPLTLRHWREASRGFVTETGEKSRFQLEIHGNQFWDRGGESLPNLSREDLKKIRANLQKRNAQAALFHMKLKRGGTLDEQTASLLLHIAHPDHYIPYRQTTAEQALKNLGLEDNRRYSPDFSGFNSLARDLLADEELGFENLADVAYFLQRLAAREEPLDSGFEGAIGQHIPLQRMELVPEEVDSQLVIPESVLNQAVAALNAGKHVILIGPPGTGKTTLAEDLCRYAHDRDCNRGHILVTATADWTTFDTIGGYMPESGERLTFRPGIFLEAIKARKWLVIDEINRADIDKAFGELFTLLSGQAVTLPYKIDGNPVRILPPEKLPPGDGQSRDYQIHQNWRIIGTMNVYDKASLFEMSYAFMRRFAFIDVPVPAQGPYKRLVTWFMNDLNIQAEVAETLTGLFDAGSPDNHLMTHRALGPAIAKDIIRYLKNRTGSTPVQPKHLAEALMLYVTPQFDGLDERAISAIYSQLKEKVFPEPGPERLALLARIEDLFPFVEFDAT